MSYLIGIKKTLWVQRLDVLDIFQNLHSSVVACMKSICEAGPRYWSTNSVTDAKGLLLPITASDFISALVVTNKCLKYVKPLHQAFKQNQRMWCMQ